MNTIEKIARAIYDAQLSHYGKYRGNVDTPFDELSESRKRELRVEARAACYAAPDSIETLVKQFHICFNVPFPNTLSEIHPDREKMRLNIDLEEFLELVSACGMELFHKGEPVLLENCTFISNGKTPDPVEIADALGDGIYVKYGHAIERGLPLDDCLREIHRSNMSKLDENGNPILRDDGKILKGPNYSPPDLDGVIYAI